MIEFRKVLPVWWSLCALLTGLTYSPVSLAQDVDTLISQSVDECISWTKSFGETTLNPFFKLVHEQKEGGNRQSILIHNRFPVRIEQVSMPLQTLSGEPIFKLSCLVRWIDPDNPLYPHKFPISETKIDLNRIEEIEPSMFKNAIIAVLNDTIPKLKARKYTDTIFVGKGNTNLLLCRKDTIQTLHFMPNGASARYPEPQIMVQELTYPLGIPQKERSKCP